MPNPRHHPPQATTAATMPSHVLVLVLVLPHTRQPRQPRQPRRRHPYASHARPERYRSNGTMYTIVRCLCSPHPWPSLPARTPRVYPRWQRPRPPSLVLPPLSSHTQQQWWCDNAMKASSPSPSSLPLILVLTRPTMRNGTTKTTTGLLFHYFIHFIFHLAAC